jgi:hypothetical protein
MGLQLQPQEGAGSELTISQPFLKEFQKGLFVDC